MLFALFPLVLAIKSYIEQDSLDLYFGSSTAFICLLLVQLAVLILFITMKLETEIDQDKIHFQMFPFTKKEWNWSEVKSAKVVNYGFVGGWGIRIGTKYGTVYNIKGKMGLAIELKNGKKYCIGTQKPEALSEVIKLIKI